MEYNFINSWFFVGLIGAGIPWAIFFADGRHLRLQRTLLWVQGLCLGILLLNILYGVFVVFT